MNKLVTLIPNRCKAITRQFIIKDKLSISSLEFISAHIPIPKSSLREAHLKGAVWLKNKGRKLSRLRESSYRLQQFDELAIYYDADVLATAPPSIQLIRDCQRYSVWYKPPKLMVEGSKFGDHATLERMAELYYRPNRRVFLIHRLDREASGLVLTAHNSESAAKLNALFQTRQIIKEYHISVKGNLAEKAKKGFIDIPLDGKACLTEFTLIKYQIEDDISQVKIRLHTGRYHQIRRHFNAYGYPVMGDPKYGQNNKNTTGMQLVATRLSFSCPFTKQLVDVSLDRFS